ncbi:MAG: TolC family protein [Ignavibacteriaceae bacterium]|nr:TolC family protein [Ignavibacteriaceae bacterium]
MLLKVSGFFLLFTLVVTAQEEYENEGRFADSILTVDKAIEMAVNKNPQLKQTLGVINAKKGARKKSFGLSSPELFWFREGIGNELPSGFAEQRWGISQTIDFPLKTAYRLGKISSEISSLEYSYESEVKQIKADIKKSYTDVIHAGTIIRLRNEELDLAKKLLNAATLRFEAGESPELEKINAEIFFAEVQNDVSDAERNFMQARYNLFNLIGLDPDEQKYSIRFPDSLVFVDVSVSQKEALSYLEDQPQYKSVKERISAAGNAISEAWSSFLPDFRINYYRQDYGQGYNNYGVELALKFPLWFFLNQSGEIQEASSNKEEMEWKLKSVELEIKKQIEHAWHGYEITLRTINRYQDNISVKSKELLDLSLEAYRLGQANLLTLLNSQRTYLNGRIRYFDSLRDYYYQIIELERFLTKDVVYVHN